MLPVSGPGRSRQAPAIGAELNVPNSKRMFEWPGHGLARHRIPDSGGVISARGGHQPAIRAETAKKNGTLVRERR